MSALVLAQALEGDVRVGLEALASGFAAIGYGLGVIGSAIGVALIWSAVINGTARQPEAQSKLMSIAWTTFVLVEVLALIGLVVFFLV
ncbi:ATP F0F1 synthase subunit C [Actinokineospora sp. G85]|uniref:ATP F0F1 synthase subunit C n=1 Tax=Actinokineospora sp. G85 TaxID=3406626 RepID=UPI003C732802